ncbi:DUF4191 domain-containing protein [Propionibacteriaceae bacterium Y1923]|uniref:DUF4191 domain-containing protein n=1 Tax=Aestuariimicrobium sp. Y1814 TaxID=3418742 RepID=UPI003C1C8B48
MARSEKAKELEAKQKAAAKAEKERKKNSDDPRDWGQLRQIRETYKMASEFDPAMKWWLLGAGLVGILAGAVAGIFLDPWWMWLIVGVMLGITLAMMVFLRRVKRATYTKFDGQAGSAEVALGMLDKKKWISTPAIAANKSFDVIHRTLGPGGLILISEGEPTRAKALLATEVKRHEQVAYGVKVITISMGKGEGQVPLDKLADHIKKLPKTMDATKIAEVKQRLKAIDAMRSRMPIPKGPINTRGARQAMRGR